jgi:hypothetical protein
LKTFQTVLACLVLAGVVLAQSNSSGPSLTARPASPAPSAAAAGETASVAPDAPVITVQGLCDKPAASSAATTDCKTVITRAEFEKVVNAIQPNMPDAAKKQLAVRYVTNLFFAGKARDAGLDHGPDFDEKLYLVRLQLLAALGSAQVHQESAKVTDAEIAAYYHDHISDYKTISYDRLYIPKQKKIAPAAQNVNDPDLQKTREASQGEMKAEADKLRVRAAAGEDFSKLQREAYDFGGYTQIKASSPRVDKARKASIPPADASIFELKVGEVSQVYGDPGGFVIYKIEAIEDVPVASVHDEISRTLASGREKGAIESLQSSTKLDDAYFVTPAAPPAAAPPTLRGPGDATSSPTPSSPTSAPGKK